MILYIFGICPTILFGLLFSSSKIIQSQMFQNNKKKVIFLSLLSIIFLFKLDIFINLGGYKGIENSLASFLFFQLFTYYLLK